MRAKKSYKYDNRELYVFTPADADTNNINQLAEYILDTAEESTSIMGMTNVIVKDDNWILKMRLWDKNMIIDYHEWNNIVVRYVQVTVDRNKYGIHTSYKNKD